MARTIPHNETVYCSVGDVSELFRKEGAFSPTSNPSSSDVLSRIRRKSTVIDEYTRHAWRPNRRESETKNFHGDYRWGAGRPVTLDKMAVRPLDADEGDKLEVWVGEWEDWVADESRTYGREGDYWLEERDGVLWLYKRFMWRSAPQMRITYRYGEDSPTENVELDNGEQYEVITQPGDIREACLKLVAKDLALSDQYTQLVPGGDGAPSAEAGAQQWEDDVYGTEYEPGLLDRHKIDPAWVEPL